MSPRWSLWGQKTKQDSIPLKGTLWDPDNLSRHQVGLRSNVEIKVTYHGSVWGEWGGKRRGILGFSIELIQPHEAILKDTQVTLSFDCHPDEEKCHKPGSDYCQNPNEEHGMQRGIVRFSLPNTKYGQSTERSITEERRRELSPNISFSGTSFTLGTMGNDVTESKTLKSSWSFKTHVLPPAKFNKFTSHTEARFDWKQNQGDCEDFPSAIRCGAIIDCHEDKGHTLPMGLSITGSLKGWYFAKLRMRKYVIDIPSGGSNLDNFIENVHGMLGTMATIKVQVESQNPGEDDSIVRITSQGDIADN